MKIKPKFIVVALLIVLGFILGLRGSQYFTSARRASQQSAAGHSLTWDLTGSDFPESINEFDSHTVPIVLRNDSDAPVDCRAIRSRFGQMEFRDAADERLVFPHTIAGRESHKYLVHVRPQHVAGVLPDQITAEFVDAGEALQVSRDIRFLVVPAWSAFPDRVAMRRDATGAYIDAIVDVYDGIGMGLPRTGEIVVSDRAMLQGSIEQLPKAYHDPEPRSVILQGGKRVAGGDDPLWKYRFSLRIACLNGSGAPTSPFGFIRIPSQAKGIPPLVVRVAIE